MNKIEGGAVSKHTPGPWKAEQYGIVTAIVGGQRRQVASTVGDAATYGNSEVTAIEIQEANTRLIAAAPELLEALEGLLVESEDLCSADFKRAHAAVAKAKL